MKATILDLRNKSKEIVEALDRHERVELYHRGKKKGVIVPVGPDRAEGAVEEHPAFGMWKDREDLKDVGEWVRKSRKGRHAFDTDVLIWMLRGNEKAARTIEREDARSVSIVNYMELVRGARDGRELRGLKSFLSDFSFEVLPLTENIGHRAALLMEDHAISSGLEPVDALIAATALEQNLALCTANLKRCRPIKNLSIKAFRP